MKFNSYSEAAKQLLGVSYYNGSIKEKLEKYCLDNDVKIELKRDDKVYCLQCNKEIKKGKKFCNPSCAAKYNNRHRVVSEQQKEKVRQTLRNKLNKNDGEYIIGNSKPYFLYKKICPICNNEFLGKKKQKYCSPKCAQNSPEVKQKIREKVQERIDNGTFSGWKTRNIKSYAEIFWENVLDNNRINYIREDFSTKKYFLDFFLNSKSEKIDLEIDGKQHTYEERVQHDIERDEYLQSKGYIVYRIP